MAVDLRQTHFRFGKDDGTESGHTFWQLEDVNHSQEISANWVFLLRFTEQEAGGTAALNTDAQFQYNKNGAGWVDITTTSSVVRAVAVGAFTNGQACTQRLSGTGTFETSGAGCTEDGSSGGAANDIAASGNSETEAGLEVVYADVANNDTIQLRFRSPDWTVTYTITPTLTITFPQNRRGQVSWAELEVPNEPRRGQISWAELETPNAPRRGQVSWTEFEVPSVSQDRRGQISWAEFETPDAPRRGQLSWAELEIPNQPRRGQVSWVELEVPNEPRRGQISWSELEVPNAPPTYVTYGSSFLWTAVNWGSVNVYLEVYIRATTGTVYARLLDGNNSPVTNSEVSTASATFQRLRSSALTLTNALTYRVQFGKAGADAGEFLGARLIMIPV